MNMKKIGTIAGSIAAAIALSAGAASCMGPSTADQAREQRNDGIAKLRANHPVQAMDGYSPTLTNVNRWADTWDEEGKVAYVYMQRRDGAFAGYYVFDGLPVNYCVSGSPTYDFERHFGAEFLVDAPALDGAYYGGCNSDRYYGFDAVTGMYMEYTDGSVLTATVVDQPLSLDEQPFAYGSTIEDVEKGSGD